MPLRLLALLTGLCVLTAGCGGRPPADVAAAEQEPPAATDPPPPRADATTAEPAFGVLTELDEAWKRHDCAGVADLTAWAEKPLGGRACEGTRNGRPALYSDTVFFLPDEPGWFAALARKPSPAYFVFVFEGGRWRLGAGPIPARGEPVRPGGTGVTADPDLVTEAALVPQRHLTFLTDPAGVNGVRFPAGDPVRGLLDEILARPAQVRPDRLDIDVELVDGPARAVALSAGSMLVFDVVRLTYRQRPKAGRTALRHPLKGLSPEGTELVELASVLSATKGLTTVGTRRGIAG
ncbi:hypothetical protein [Nonomuraea roseoviolacea]|uniref:Uncharacterized protein n=1 Tax=Nonomuraea roseoviolacea subsp. carminata TaxID=160689 RepID=A0ABT1JX09_9ACTN|nr:hypothetical protein [Nonomuraea roseoviolacea]MCP2345894.1 hypothetical protein [Nonomuraea roseoviolacea subsp. carminata]